MERVLTGEEGVEPASCHEVWQFWDLQIIFLAEFSTILVQSEQGGIFP
jgi:hypothetical protein